MVQRVESELPTSCIVTNLGRDAEPCGGDCSHEPFLSERVDRGHQPPRLEGRKNSRFGFCKTEFKPYDLVVQSCLIVLKTRLAIKVCSDGENDAWNDARKVCQSVLGYGVRVVAVR